MEVIACSIPTCDFKADNISEALAIALLANHSLAHQSTLPNITGPLLLPVPRGPTYQSGLRFRPNIPSCSITIWQNLPATMLQNASTTHGTVGRCTPLILDHHVFTRAEWKRACLRDQPRVPITISVDTSAQTRYSTPTSTSNTHVEVSAITDIGTQSDLWSMKDFLACVFSHDNLLCVSLGLSATSLSPISIEGAFFARLTTKLHNGEVTLCNSMVYVSSSVPAMYLLHESLLNHGILSKGFLSLQTVDMPKERCDTKDADAVNATCEPWPINAVQSINDGCNTTGDQYDVTCSCPQQDTMSLQTALPLALQKTTEV